MAKPKNPLHSFGAIGRLGEGLTFARRRRTDIVEKTPIPKDAKSLAQLSWRHMYQKAVALWHALSADEQQEWESQARSRHMTGFAWFISQALKPNPGLYLPLQGGTMSGDIDMAKNKLLKLPLPSDSQEPLTLAYFTANIAPYLYNECVRAFHSVNQLIPNNTLTALALDSERWDTDTMHDLVINNNRITFNTAGIYYTGASASFETNIVGRRYIMLRRSDGLIIAMHAWDTNQNEPTRMSLGTSWRFAVGQYVEVLVIQGSGGNLNIVATLYHSPEFWAHRVGI